MIQPIHILFLEDERVLAAKIKQLLEYENYSVAHALNGLEGLKLAKELKPDLVICDIMMPLMDGYEFYEAFNELGYRDVPFIFLTANSNHEDFRKGMNIGADDYLTKPINRHDLVEAITARLTKKRDIDNELKEMTAKFTAEIARRDTCLRDIAQNQSHVIRAPLATLMAVTNMIKVDEIEGDNKILVQMLPALAEQLDKVIRENVYQINQLV